MMINTNKKIAFFLPSLRGGGAERMMLNLANKFSDESFDVDLVLCQKVGPYVKDIDKNIRVFELNVKRALFSLFPLINYLKNERPKIIISSLEHINVITILSKILAYSKTKIIIRVANTISDSLRGEKIIKRWFLLISAMLFYRFANEIITNSKGSADNLSKTLKISREKIKVIYNPTVTSDLFEKMKFNIEHPWLKKIINDQQNLIKKEEVHNTMPVILGVGRLTNQKNFSLLIQAFNIIRKKRNCRLIILGEGEERNKLEKIIKELGLKEDIDMPGFVDNPYAYMARSDVYVLSSLWEGLPNTLIEAMACGTSVVSTDCPSGPTEILENGKYGKLVSTGDAYALARAIDGAIDNPIDKQKLHDRAKDFSIENAVNKYLEIING